jgi:hypothetical protein
MTKKMAGEIRRELTRAVHERYARGSREEKIRILDEFVLVSGYHRKAAIRILNAAAPAVPSRGKRRPKLYDDAVHQGLTLLWEASDRVCGKRLKALLPMLIPALERHGHLQLDPIIRSRLMAISAATIDRLLRDTRSGNSRRQAKRKPTIVQRQVAVRTFADWIEPLPGYAEMDLVAHCGARAGGSHLHTLSLTDLASGWTECAPLLVRDGRLVVESVEGLRVGLPFLLRGLDVDNGSEFLNDALLSYCGKRGIELTRSRPYQKNDQAWIEQKNGSVVRRLVGYRRMEGMVAFEALSQLYSASRLFVNFFQPSFKLKEKVRTGARVLKRYYPPETPCARLLASTSVSDMAKARLRDTANALDPLQLLDRIREMQTRLAIITAGGQPPTLTRQNDDLSGFLSGLATAWHQGEVRPTHRADAPSVRHWRTRSDPFESVWPLITQWLEADTSQTAKCIFARLQREKPGAFPDGQLRSLQRRIRDWRGTMAHRLVFGTDVSSEMAPIPSFTTTGLGNIRNEARG